MAGPWDFLSAAPHGFEDWSEAGGSVRDPGGLDYVFHDYGQTPARGFQRGAFLPYHIVVDQAGRLILSYRLDQVAPHAFHYNPRSIGIAYGAPVGTELTPEARETMTWLAANMPAGGRRETHGEAYERTRGTPQQASAQGRGMDEARSWVGIFRNEAPPSAPTVTAAATEPRGLIPFTASHPAAVPTAAPSPQTAAPSPFRSIVPAPQPAAPTPAPTAMAAAAPQAAVAAPAATPSGGGGLLGRIGNALTGFASSGGGGEQDPGARAIAEGQSALSQHSNQLAQLLQSLTKPAGYRDGGAVAAAIRIAARNTDTDPSEAQKKAGNYAKGRLRFAGLGIVIENPKGSERRGVDKGGKPWVCRLPAHYGYFSRTEGKDGDQVDCYIGDRPEHDVVWVVDQIDPATKRFDEHKVMLGFPTREEAVSTYKKAFSDGKGADRIGGVREMHVEKFKRWLRDGDTTKPARRAEFADGGTVREDGMPLLKGKKNVGHNIGEMMHAGHPRDQAIAAALRVAGGRKSYADGGAPEDIPLLDAPLPDTGPMETNLFDWRRAAQDAEQAFGPIDYAAAGPDPTSAGYVPPVDSPLTDRFAGPGGAPVAREVERFLRGYAEDALHMPSDMVAHGISGIASGDPARAVGGIGEAALGAALPVLPGVGAARRLMQTAPITSGATLGGALGALPQLTEYGLPFSQASAQTSAPAAGPDPERVRVLSASAERLERQAEEARLRRESMRPRGLRTIPDRNDHPGFWQADAEFQRLDQEAKAARLALKGELDKGTPEYRARQAAQEQNERQVGDAVAAGRQVLDTAQQPFHREFGKTGERWSLAPVLLGTATGLGMALPGTVSQIRHARRWRGALDEAQGLPGARGGQPPSTERQATALETARRYADRGHPSAGASDYLIGYGLPTAFGAGEGIASVALPHYWNYNLPRENPEWTSLQTYYRSLPEGHADKERARKLLEDDLALSRRNPRQEQAETFFREPWGPMRGAALEGAGTALTAATLSRAFRPGPKRWSALEDETRAVDTVHGPRLSRSLEPAKPPPVVDADARPVITNDGSGTPPRALEAGPTPSAGQTATRTPPPEPADSLARLPAQQGRRGSLPPLPGEGGASPRPGTGATPEPRRLRDLIDPNEAPPVPTGQASPTPPTQTQPTIPAVRPVRGVDRLGRTYWYNPGTGNRMSAPPRQSRGQRPKPGEKPEAEKPQQSKPPKKDETPQSRPTESDAERANREAAESIRRGRRRDQGALDDDEGRRRGGRVDPGALQLARSYANGGLVVGPVVGETGGRADAKPVDVEGGSYVIPADIVAALGEGNTMAGHRVLYKVFGQPGRATGGPVPIRISDGEHVLTAAQVAKQGGGDHAKGCRVLDRWVKDTRAKQIKHLKSLPGPAKG